MLMPRNPIRLPLVSVALFLAVLSLALAAARSRAMPSLRHAGAATKPVHYYRAENVATSFAEGAVLDAEPTRTT